MDDQQSVMRAADAATDWLVDKGYMHVLVEVANEADNAGFKHDIIKPTGGAVRLIERLKERSKGKVGSPAGRLLVSTSLNGGRVPSDSLVNVVDFVLLHGNGVQDPARITQMVDGDQEAAELSRAADCLQRGRSFRFQQAAKQHAGRAARLFKLGILRLPDGRRAVRRRVPERAGQLDDQLAAKAGVLRASVQGDGCRLTLTERSQSRFSAGTAQSHRSATDSLWNRL